MNGNSFLVDTNVVLYLLKGSENVSRILQNRQVFLSFVTELELFSFKELSRAEYSNISSFLSECNIIDINTQIKEIAVSIRRKYSTKLPDAIIAATSQFLNIPLLTNDKDFSKIKELDILCIEK